ncbi:MAG TPA: hypothetical protein VGL81_28885 [Polyangiaceae bacterium]|jgi:hypothetical protein
MMTSPARRRFAAILSGAGLVVPLALGFAACSSKGASPHASPSGDSSAPTDGGGAADAPLACPPENLDEWNAGSYHHAQPIQPAACNQLLMNDYFASCLGPSSSSDTCEQNWGAGEDAAHATCQNCILTPSSATLWGPLVDYSTGSDGGAGGTVAINVAGCVEILDPSQLSCAMSVQLADECQHAACDTVCPVADMASYDDWVACIDATAQGECLMYLQSAACVNAEDAGPAAACVTGQTFQDEFFSIATVFCGGAATKD